MNDEPKMSNEEAAKAEMRKQLLDGTASARERLAYDCGIEMGMRAAQLFAEEGALHRERESGMFPIGEPGGVS